MTSPANRAARGLLTLIFLAAAFAKAHGNIGSLEGTAPRNPWPMNAMIVVDVAVAALLLGRRWRTGSVAAVLVAAGGNVV